MFGMRQRSETIDDLVPRHVERERDRDRAGEVRGVCVARDGRTPTGPDVDGQRAAVPGGAHVHRGALGLRRASHHGDTPEACAISERGKAVSVDVEHRCVDRVEDLRLRGDDAIECLHPLEVHRADRGDDADGGLDPPGHCLDLSGAVGPHLGDEDLGSRREMLVDRAVKVRPRC